MGEDCSFLVAFAGAARTSAPPSVLAMWLLPLALAMAFVIAVETGGCFDEDRFGTTSVRIANGSVPSTTAIGMRRTGSSNQGTAIVAGRGYRDSRVTALSTCRHGRDGMILTLDRLNTRPRQGRGGSDDLANSEGSGVVAGGTLHCIKDEDEGKSKIEEQEGRHSAGGVGWRERDAASRR